MTLVHKGTRISNIELLRIVSMIMVLNLHTFGGTEHGAGIIQAMDFSGIQPLSVQLIHL